VLTLTGSLSRDLLERRYRLPLMSLLPVGSVFLS
jgi:hypothetical protein